MAIADSTANCVPWMTRHWSAHIRGGEIRADECPHSDEDVGRTALPSRCETRPSLLRPPRKGEP
jgi:hypothetical protein